MRHVKPLRCLVFQQAQSAGKLKKSIKQRKAVNYIFQKKLFIGAIPHGSIGFLTLRKLPRSIPQALPTLQPTPFIPTIAY